LAIKCDVKQEPCGGGSQKLQPVPPCEFSRKQSIFVVCTKCKIDVMVSRCSCKY
jgi:hypothetical protein